MSRLSEQDRRDLGLLLTPSWLSGLVAVVIGLIISVGVIAAFEAHNSTVQQQLIAWQQTQPQAPVTEPGQTVSASSLSSDLKGTWPLLIFWSVVGIAVYIIVAGIMHSLSEANELRREMGFVNAKPTAIMAETVAHAILRAFAGFLAIVFAAAILKQIIPYSITAAHAAASDLLTVNGALYSVLSFSLIFFSLHLETILMRLSMGRLRLGSTGV